MSSHTCNSLMNGKRVSVLTGWDAPLQGFFLVVEEIPGDDDSDDYVYSNLSDPALLEWMGLPPDLGYFIEKLKELEIEVPERMLDEVRADKAGNVGNRRVVYDAVGNFKEPRGR